MSRNSQQRRRKFFAEHPVCCFCGGRSAAVEEDHFPSRALFRERVWPEGYAFPACVKCNRVTSDDELIVAVLSRVCGGQRRRHGQSRTGEVSGRRSPAVSWTSQRHETADAPRVSKRAKDPRELADVLPEFPKLARGRERPVPQRRSGSVGGATGKLGTQSRRLATTHLTVVLGQLG
jgi:hypothetical protein